MGATCHDHNHSLWWMFRCRRVGRIDNTHVAFRSITRHGEAERIKLPRRRMLIAHFVTLCLRRGRLRARRRPYGSGSGIHCVGTFAQVATTENHTSSARASEPRPMGGRWARGGHQSGFRSAEMLGKKPLDCALGRFTKTPFLDIHIVIIVIVIVIK